MKHETREEEHIINYSFSNIEKVMQSINKSNLQR